MLEHTFVTGHRCFWLHHCHIFLQGPTCSAKWIGLDPFAITRSICTSQAVQNRRIAQILQAIGRHITAFCIRQSFTQSVLRILCYVFNGFRFLESVFSHYTTASTCTFSKQNTDDRNWTTKMMNAARSLVFNDHFMLFLATPARG